MKLRWKPSEFANLSTAEKALMIAFIDERIEEEEKQARKIKSKGR